MADARWPAAAVLNSRPNKHVEAGDDDLKDRGSTPLASTILIIRDLQSEIVGVTLWVIQCPPWVELVTAPLEKRETGLRITGKLELSPYLQSEQFCASGKIDLCGHSLR